MLRLWQRAGARLAIAYAYMVSVVTTTYASNCVAWHVVVKWEWRYTSVLAFSKLLSLLVMFCEQVFSTNFQLDFSSAMFCITWEGFALHSISQLFQESSKPGLLLFRVPTGYKSRTLSWLPVLLWEQPSHLILGTKLSLNVGSLRLLLLLCKDSSKLTL